MFYIISSENVGPNADPNHNCVWITKTEPRTNTSNAVLTRGWLGMTNDISKYAHGEFETLEDAQDAIETLLKHDGYRVDELLDDEEDVLIRYLVGDYERLSEEESINMCWATREEIKAHTTDETIRDLVAADAATILSEFEQELNQEAVIDMLIEYRDELLEERVNTDRACAEDEALNNAFEAGCRIGAINAFLFISTKYGEQSCENRTIESVLWDCKTEIARIKEGK
jgi:hypothetical protein